MPQFLIVTKLIPALLAELIAESELLGAADNYRWRIRQRDTGISCHPALDDGRGALTA
jgi:hypothetical protein